MLDFAGNIERHGPIDMVQPYRQGGDGNGRAPVKTCPNCRSVVFAGFRHCPDCHHEFPPPETELKPTATTRPIISHAAPFWVKVEKISYERHRKIGKPDSLRVDYYESPYSIYSEWICLEHGGRAARRAHRWWIRHGGDPAVITVGEALQQAATLRHPSHILVQEDGKYWRVVRHRFDGAEPPEVEVEQEYEYADDSPLVEEEAPF